MRWTLLISCFLIISCNTEIKINDEDKVVEPDKTFELPKKVKQEIIDSVKFDIKIYPVEVRMYDYEIEARLFNKNVDTVYFLSMSCFGDKDLLEFDTAEYKVIDFTTCPVSNPTICKIAPDSSYKFNFRMSAKQDANTLKVGFDLFAVNKDFVLEFGNQINIIERPQEEKNIIYSQEIKLPK